MLNYSCFIPGYNYPLNGGVIQYYTYILCDYDSSQIREVEKCLIWCSYSFVMFCYVKSQGKAQATRLPEEEYPSKSSSLQWNKQSGKFCLGKETGKQTWCQVQNSICWLWAWFEENRELGFGTQAQDSGWSGQGWKVKILRLPKNQLLSSWMTFISSLKHLTRTTSHLNAINHSDAVEKQCIVQPPTSGDHTTGN